MGDKDMKLNSFRTECKRKNGGDTHIHGDDVKEDFKYECMLDILPRGSNAAIRSVSKQAHGAYVAGPCTSYQALHNFIQTEFDLRPYGVRHGDRVALLLPNTPENAVCVFATSCYNCCVPLHVASTADEVKFEMGNTNCVAVIVLCAQKGEAPLGVASGLEAANRLSRAVIELLPREGQPGLFSLRLHQQSRQAAKVSKAKQLNGPQDHILVLHTSGTSGTKKAVPYTAETLVVGACCIGGSWNLTPNDCALIIMPLCHIGGLARNIYSVLFSGGSMICVDQFTANPDQFWDICSTLPVTWYYGGPTFHKMILDSGHSNYTAEQRNKAKIRMVGIAAGALPPVTAGQMLKTFAQEGNQNGKGLILPSYGMTECMPISSPSIDYKLERTGTSGRKCGPEIRIFDPESKTIHGHSSASGMSINESILNREINRKTTATGHINIKGAPLFQGYETGGDGTEISADGWFDTGDMGYLDEDGYIYITGRAKEIINRGGEVLSPIEIDNAIGKHPDVNEVLSFAIGHSLLGETVALAIVLYNDDQYQQRKQDSPETTLIDDPSVSLSSNLRVLRKWIDKTKVLGPNKMPDHISFVNKIEKTQTGKAKRNDMQKILAVPAIEVEEEVHVIMNGLESFFQDGNVEKVVSDVLRTRVASTDTLGELGIDSLARARLNNTLKRALGKSSLPQRLFDGNISIEELINGLKEAVKNDATDEGGGYLDSTFGLRALCILSMVTYHANNMYGAWPAYLNEHRCLFRFPMFFLFVLSGFEVQSMYSGANAGAWRQFFVGRIAFIFPMYWLSLLMTLPFLVGSTSGWLGVSVYTLTPLALQSLSLGSWGWGEHFWYVSALFVLSWFAPWFSKWTTSMRDLRLVLPLIGMLVMCFPCWDTTTTMMGPIFKFTNGCLRDPAQAQGIYLNASGITTYSGPGAVGVHVCSAQYVLWWTSPIGRLPVFYVGFLMARLCKDVNSGIVVDFCYRYGHHFIDCMILIITFGVLAIPYYGLAVNDESLRLDFWDPGTQTLEGTWPTVVVCVWIFVTQKSRKPSVINKYVLQNRALSFFGSISYEIYLFHLPVYRLYIWFKASAYSSLYGWHWDPVPMCSVVRGAPACMVNAFSPNWLRESTGLPVGRLTSQGFDADPSYNNCMQYWEMWILIFVTVGLSYKMNQLALWCKPRSNACSEWFVDCALAAGLVFCAPFAACRKVSRSDSSANSFWRLGSGAGGSARRVRPLTLQTEGHGLDFRKSFSEIKREVWKQQRVSRQSMVAEDFESQDALPVETDVPPPTTWIQRSGFDSVLCWLVRKHIATLSCCIELM
eukprot:SAG31_NODE_107_length_24865_cov_17.973593_5_plen_1307_part_00